MARLSKRVKAIREGLDRTKLYPVTEAMELLKTRATAKFNESVDVAINLGIDPKKSDQAVRGSSVLPKGTGKTVRVAVLCKGDQAEEAKQAGDAPDGAEAIELEMPRMGRDGKEVRRSAKKPAQKGEERYRRNKRKTEADVVHRVCKKSVEQRLHIYKVYPMRYTRSPISRGILYPW